jgi:ribonuclease BN (tRNA processing enzyme)
VVQSGGKNYLFDCGPATTYKLAKHRLSSLDFDHLFLSHHHFNHVANLLSFCAASANVTPDSSVDQKTLLLLLNCIRGVFQITNHLGRPLVSYWPFAVLQIIEIHI